MQCGEMVRYNLLVSWNQIAGDSVEEEEHKSTAFTAKEPSQKMKITFHIPPVTNFLVTVG